MMKHSRIASFGIVALMTVLFASDAFADQPGERQVKQRARIHAGVDSGSLRTAEARALRAEQRHIGRTRRRMRADDGRLGIAERRRLDRMQDRSSRHIYRAKHNHRAKHNGRTR